VSGPSIGFIGFGEAGFHIARGLREAGLETVIAYDINADTPGFRDRIRRHENQSGVRLVATSEELADGSDILLSVVVAGAAIRAAEQTAPFFQSRHLYADLNSVSPTVKQSVHSIVTNQGARFVEATIMSPISPLGHRAPMLLAGSSAAELLEAMAPYGMQMEVVSDKVGSAASVKLCRSIIVKGLEALMVECAMAACHYGADERVFSSLDKSFPGLDWGKLASYMTSRVAMHGERRAGEMNEAARMLEAIGIEPIMAQAAANRQEWCARLGVGDAFDGAPPEDYRAIVSAIYKLIESDQAEPAQPTASPVTEDSYNG
jgi:3-hydroxyisobutyrate dehydrogenase-like beta-hydroxyacid dehydrogenase